MSGTEVDFVQLVEGTTGQKEGPELKEFPALFVKSIDEAKRQITALASTGDLDRHGEIILPSAFKEKLPTYLKNPVVLTSHQHRLETGHSSVVGNVVKAWIDDKGLWVVIEFAQDTELSEEYWQLYKQKKQRALSVGFIPLEWEYQEREGKSVYVHTKVELLELSCVPVGANPEALSRSKQRKADFIAAKKDEREEEKILAEIRANEPDFDEKCQEWADMILGVDPLTGSRVSEEKKYDFVRLVYAR